MKKTVKQRRNCARKASKLSITRQCELLQIHRSGLYYKPVGESELNLELMRLIDEKYMKHPFYGVRRMTVWLNKDMGYKVNRKRIARLYRLMGLQAIGPNPYTSKPGKGKNHKTYPYLLRGLKIERVNQVWAMDITYIPVLGGYLYLCAIIDVYSRYVVGWSLSNTMTTDWCLDVVKEAVAQYGSPEIFNTDQGSQFTATEFTEWIVGQGIQLSMDGKGRAIDNIFIERLWRSVKYEQIYLHPAEDGVECYQGLQVYFDFYNEERRHENIEDKTPAEMYRENVKLVA